MTHESREFDRLVARLIDDSIVDADYSRLVELMQDDPRFKEAFVDAITIDADLSTELAASRHRDTRPKPVERPVHRFTIGSVLAIAAAVAMAAAAVVIYLVVAAPVTDAPEPQPDARIATLIDASGTVICKQGVANPGEDYAAGEYSIESGSAQFMLTSRVAVNLHGRTRIVMHGDMSATLTKGTATFHCPSGAEGYTVFLPDGSRVVDLGTSFRVDVDDDSHCRVAVTQGRVQVIGPGDAPTAQTIDAGAFARYTAGRWVREDAPGLVDTRGLALWYSASRGVETDPGRGVVSWSDTTTEFNTHADDASQLDPARRPKLVDTDSGRPAIRFEGQSAGLGVEPVEFGHSRTITMVIDPAGAADDTIVRTVYHDNGDPNASINVQGEQLQAWMYSHFDQHARFDTSIGDGPMVVSYVYDPVANHASLWVNGDRIGDAVAPVSAAIVGSPHIGGHATAKPGDNFIGDLYELAVHDAALSSEEITAIHQQLMDRLGETLAPSVETPLTETD